MCFTLQYSHAVAKHKMTLIQNIKNINSIITVKKGRRNRNGMSSMQFAASSNSIDTLGTSFLRQIIIKRKMTLNKKY